MPDLISPRQKKLDLLKSLEVPDTSSQDTTNALHQLAAIYGLQQEQQTNPVKLSALQANTTAQELQNRYYPQLTEQKLAAGQEALATAPVERAGLGLHNRGLQEHLDQGGTAAAIEAQKAAAFAARAGGIHALGQLPGGLPKDIVPTFYAGQDPSLLVPQEQENARIASKHKSDYITSMRAGAPINPDMEAQLGISPEEAQSVTPGASPSRIHQAATPAHFAQLLMSLYGPTMVGPTSNQIYEHLPADFSSIPEQGRRSLDWLKAFLGQQQQPQQ